MSSSTTVTYPPAAHLSTDQPAAVTHTQPAPVAAMSLDPASRDNAQQAHKAERIRGGCIPCPVSPAAFTA